MSGQEKQPKDELFEDSKKLVSDGILPVETDKEEERFKETAKELLDVGDVLKSGSEAELDWLAECAKLTLRHRLFEIIRGKSI